MWIVCAVRPTKSGNYIFEDCGQRKLYRIHAAGYHPVEKSAYDFGNSGNEKRIPGSYETGIVPRWVQSKPVSYTHLDVYKRQQQSSWGTPSPQ